MFKKEYPNAYYLIALITIGILLYGITLTYQFNIDDGYATPLKFEVSKGLKGIPVLLKQPFVYVGADYRPIVHISYCIEAQFFGLNPTVHRIFNLFYYLLLIIVSYFLVLKIFENKWIAFLSLLIFIIHPVNVDVVASLKNRDIMLSLLLANLATLFFIFFAEKNKKIYFILGFLLINISYYSKMDSLPYLLFIPTLLHFKYKRNFKECLMLFATLVMLFICCRVLLVTHIVGSFNREIYFWENPMVGATFIQKLEYVFLAFKFYFTKLLIPLELSIFYGYDTINIKSFFTWSSLVFLFTFLIMLIFLLKNKQYKIILVLFVLLLYFAMFANPFMVAPDFVALRYMFSPTFLFSIFVALMMYYFINKYKMSIILYMIVMVAFSILTFQRITIWKDKQMLLEHDIKITSNSYGLNYIIADLYLSMTQMANDEHKLAFMDLGRHYALAASKIYSNFYMAYLQLAKSYELANDKISASKYYQEAIKKPSFEYNLYYEYGRFLLTTQDTSNAIKYLKMSLSKIAHYDNAIILLSKIYLKQHNYNEVVSINQAGIKYCPLRPEYYVNIAKAYYFQKKYEKALPYLYSAYQNGYDNYSIISEFMNYCQQNNDMNNYKKLYEIQRKSIQ